MTVEIVEEAPAAFADYARIPIGFEVREVFDVVVREQGCGGLELVERLLADPYYKNFDADPTHHPTQWPLRFDTSRWGVLGAFADGSRVGGAVIAWGAPGIDLLEHRADLAVVWDLRVAPDARGRGVGAALFRAAERWAVVRGARWLKVETQNVNVAACRFYAGQGCTLGAMHRFAYPDLPDETQLCWYKQLDLLALWDFTQPEVSEQRFRSALAAATSTEALILQTQIARTYGLRREFDRARQILQSLEPALPGAGAEARTRYFLELGRSYASATHPAESQTDAARESARAAYREALECARQGGLDALAIDAIHMLAFVDPAPAQQLYWAHEALTVIQQSVQPAARRWEAPVRNNLGYALHQMGRYEEALEAFEQAVTLRRSASDAEALRVAYWMVAWTMRALNRHDQALEIQLRLEHECAAAGKPDPYVFEELEVLYRARGDDAHADHYAELGREGRSQESSPI
jgi:GNAT superfamily N-acetyltransferase/tetratricopeptide (TPR) repeat protein